jgi:hypothetical protein
VFGVEGETKHKRYFLLVHFFALPKKKKKNELKKQLSTSNLVKLKNLKTKTSKTHSLHSFKQLKFLASFVFKFNYKLSVKGFSASG